MKSITKDDIKEIANELEYDIRTFIHKSSGQILYIPKEINIEKIDMELWGEDIEELENNFSDYDEIEKWSKKQFIELMIEFAEQINTITLQNKPLSTFNLYKPFSEFKILIDNTNDYREAWFAFKNQWQMEYVAEKLRKMGYLG